MQCRPVLFDSGQSRDYSKKCQISFSTLQLNQTNPFSLLPDLKDFPARSPSYPPDNLHSPITAPAGLI
ncbi:hypothetical protein L1987_83651 [Smallanthus sonchifolius]|uniref:Uncharacterized protein n=1 Tax=Smallanthus sonchifolius TaxID=185202 RepID=A0ACB8YDP1_9ASTR|nr:hypothetical protein L1987_83651 [Smallanthus sonchifolius]